MRKSQNGRRRYYSPSDPVVAVSLISQYDASDTSSITHVGGRVSQINDLQGGRHLTQSNAEYQPFTGTTVNSLNALKLSWDSDGMGDVRPLFFNAPAYSATPVDMDYVFVLGEPELGDSGIGVGSLIVGPPQVADIGTYIDIYSVGQVIYDKFTIEQGNIEAYTYYHIFIVRIRDGNCKIYKDQTLILEHTTFDNTLAWASPGLSDGGTLFGGDAFYYLGGISARFCELWVKIGGFSDPDLLSLSTVLAAKWGTP